MEFRNNRANHPGDKLSPEKSQEHIVEVDQKVLLSVTEKICQNGNCRYPLLALRILIHCIGNMDSNGHIAISARQLAKSMDIHYDTVTKCLKYLRSIQVIEYKR